MTLAQISSHTEAVSAEFERLLTTKKIVVRRESKQWSFLRHCFSVLLDGRSRDAPYTKQQVMQYRFEVEDKLRRYYLSPGRPVPFVFRLIHVDKALSLHLIEETYPNANGYVLLVAEDARDAPMKKEEISDILERVVTEAMEAEWAVYKELPEISLRPLEGHFLPNSPAYNRIRHLVQRHHDRRWTILEPENNPSTKRLLDVKIVQIEGQRAFVRTKEYWYLRWYSLAKGDYARVDYRETNIQTYVLARSGNRWLVEENIYPPPRASTPHRKTIVVG